MKRLLWLAFLIVFLQLSLSAGKKAPLPKALFEAKTVYIDNRTGNAELGDKAYDEMVKWGRYKIVEEPQDADLVFILTTEEWSAGSMVIGNVGESGNVILNQVPRRSGTTYLTVFNGKTGAKLWANSKDWGRFKSATRGIIKDLKDRMSETAP